MSDIQSTELLTGRHSISQVLTLPDIAASCNTCAMCKIEISSTEGEKMRYDLCLSELKRTTAVPSILSALRCLGGASHEAHAFSSFVTRRTHTQVSDIQSTELLIGRHSITHLLQISFQHGDSPLQETPDVRSTWHIPGLSPACMHISSLVCRLLGFSYCLFHICVCNACMAQLIHTPGTCFHANAHPRPQLRVHSALRSRSLGNICNRMAMATFHPLANMAMAT